MGGRWQYASRLTKSCKRKILKHSGSSAWVPQLDLFGTYKITGINSFVRDSSSLLEKCYLRVPIQGCRFSLKNYRNGAFVSSNCNRARVSVSYTTGASSILSREKVDCVVIGAGVTGLAIAQELAKQGREVIVVEAASSIGTGTSSRNSEVIHAGIYYPSGSLKGRFCVEGKHLLYNYCKERNIPHRSVGKLIVGTNDKQLLVLDKLLSLGRANGVDDLRILSKEEATDMEPALRCLKALFSPSTGIVDSHAFMMSLQTDAERMGTTLALCSKVTRGLVTSEGIELVVESSPLGHNSGEEVTLLARVVVNAAGLYAQSIARRIDGVPSHSIPKCHYAKGCYFYLSGCGKPFHRLIYPVPEEGGIGVHVTMDLGGQTRFGPDVEWLTNVEDKNLYPAGFDYTVEPGRGDRFYSEIRKYFPALPDGALQPGYSGIRPKLSGKGHSPSDFCHTGNQDTWR